MRLDLWLVVVVPVLGKTGAAECLEAVVGIVVQRRLLFCGQQGAAERTQKVETGTHGKGIDE